MQEEECGIVNESVCQLVEDQECSTTMEEVCNIVEETECTIVNEEKCATVDKNECQIVTDMVSSSSLDSSYPVLLPEVRHYIRARVQHCARGSL